MGGAEVVASGSFASNSGTNLNLVVNWSVVSEATGQRTLQMTLNGVTYSSNSRAINYRGTAMATHPLAYFSVPNYQGPAAISVVFHFNGTLSGRPVNDIVATGTITA